MLNYAMAGLQMGLGLFNQGAEQSEARRQARFAQRQQDFQRNQQNLQIRRANERAQQIYGQQLQLHKKQLRFNEQAAQRAFASEQIRLNEAFTGMAFQGAAQQRQLMKAMGANVAMNEGNRGRSFERASMIETLGTFGRMQAEKAEQLSSMRGQSRRNMERIALDRYGADLASYQNVMIAPQMQQEIARGPRIPMPSSNNLLGIANTAFGAFQTGISLTAPGSGFLGFKAPVPASD